MIWIGFFQALTEISCKTINDDIVWHRNNTVQVNCHRSISGQWHQLGVYMSFEYHSYIRCIDNGNFVALRVNPLALTRMAIYNVYFSPGEFDASCILWMEILGLKSSNFLPY